MNTQLPMLNPTEAFQQDLYMAMQKLERAMHLLKVKGRMNDHLSNGRRMFGSPSSWFEVKEGVMRPFQPNARIVKLAYESILSGKLELKTSAIISFMDVQGFTDRQLQPLTPTRHHVRNLLSERGVMEAAGFLDYQGKWIKAQHEAIISEDTAKQILDKVAKTKPVVNAVVYCRTASRSRADSNTGIEAQASACHNFCKAKRYNIVRTFQDDGVSGSTTQRHGLDDMLRFIEASGKPHVVVVNDFNRIARDVLVGLEISERLKKLGCQIHVASQYA